MNDEARGSSKKGDVRGLIGNVVEGLVDELLEELALCHIPINGFNLEGFSAITVSMPKFDVNTVLADNDKSNLVVFNTKFSNLLLTANAIEGFQTNVDCLRNQFPGAKITTVHFSMVVDDQGYETSIREFVAERNEVYWNLDEVIAAVNPMIENVRLRMEDDAWIRRHESEETLRQWMKAKQDMSMSARISGHAGNGKTELAWRIGVEAAKENQRKIIYFDLLRFTGRIL